MPEVPTLRFGEGGGHLRDVATLFYTHFCESMSFKDTAARSVLGQTGQQPYYFPSAASAALPRPLATAAIRAGKRIQSAESLRFSRQSALKSGTRQKALGGGGEEVGGEGVRFKLIKGL